MYVSLNLYHPLFLSGFAMPCSLYPSLRVFLLLSTAIGLVACDDQGSTQQQSDIEEKITELTLPSNNIYPDQTASGSFLAGQFAQIHSDWGNAANYFETVRDLDPTTPHIENRIMALTMGAGHYDRAITIAKKLSQSPSPDDQSLAIMLAGLESFKNKNYDQTLKTLSQAKTDGLGAAVIPLFRAWAAAGNGKTDISALLDKSALSYQAVMIAGYTKDKKVLAELARTIDFTKMPIAIHNLEDVATIFALNGETETAKNILLALKAGLPERSAVYMASLKDIEDGTTVTFNMPATTPQESLAAALINVSQILDKNYQDSARIFAQMSSYLQPHADAPLELLAQIAADGKQFEEAISYLQRINTDKDAAKDIQVKRQVALLLQHSGKTDESIRILQDLAKNAKNVDAQIQIGDIYRNDEDYERSLEAYDKAFEMLDNNIPQKHWDLLFARGMVNERLKHWDQAEKDLKAALSYEPDQPYVLNYLGYSWADQGKNLDKAAEMIEKAVRLKPEDGSIVDSLGWVYFRIGNYDRAVKTLEQAIELDPTESEINDHLGDAYWRVGRKSEARFQWSRAISFTTDKDIIQKITEKLENGLPAISSAIPAAKLVDNRKQ